MFKKKLQINLLQDSADQKARRTTIIAAGIFALFVGMVAAVGAGASYRSAVHGTDLLGEVGHMLTIGDLIRFPWSAQAANGAKDVTSTPDDRLNILLLGIGGDGHDGAQLTDTIILTSLDTAQNRIGMLSIPRDLAYPLGQGRFEKINAINAYAEMDHPGEGAARTGEAISKLFNIRIDRVVRVDFKGFAKFIDALGGIDVNVKRSFVDQQFPTENTSDTPYQWTTVQFDKGMQHMTGKAALNFARSRHGNNGEGSDFARSARQQLVIEAVRTKLFSLGVMSDPSKLSALWTVFSSNIQTNMSVWDAVKLMPVAMRFKNVAITQHVLTDDPDGLLTSGNVNGAFMLFPKQPDWSDIRKIVDDPFSSKEQEEAKFRPVRTVRIEIKNGTLRSGFAAQVSEKLNGYGYTSTVAGNASERGYERTVIFDLTGGSMPEELAKLKQLLNANVSDATQGDGYVISSNGNHESISDSSQFLIVLGRSSEGLVSTNTYANP